MFELCASILSANFANLATDIRLAEESGADAFHIDVMDGHFVPAISFGGCIVKATKRSTKLPLDVHLMVDSPLQYLDELEQIGVEQVTVHLEIPGGPKKSLAEIRKRNQRVGLAINPETPISAALEFFPDIDQLLIMTVHPGKGGQTYIASSTSKIEKAKKILQQHYPNITIQVDGGVNTNTLTQVLKAGATSVVAGSAIFCGDIRKNILSIKSLAAPCISP